MVTLALLLIYIGRPSRKVSQFTVLVKKQWNELTFGSKISFSRCGNFLLYSLSLARIRRDIVAPNKQPPLLEGEEFVHELGTGLRNVVHVYGFTKTKDGTGSLFDITVKYTRMCAGFSPE